MSKLRKTIFTGFSPNLCKRDVGIALRYLIVPWLWPKWKNGKYPNIAEKELKSFFSLEHAFVFDSGRSSLQIALTALGIKKGDEVLVQAYTCVVVINAIKVAGGTPIYIDVDKSLNIDTADLERKITAKSKAVIIQHTFGQPADVERIQGIAHNHNLKTIEDCAHAFGTKHNEQYLGTFADVGMFSFGSDKSISCVRGGALITNNSDMAVTLEGIQESLPAMRTHIVFQHLAHLPIFFIGKMLYHLGFGKGLLWGAKKLSMTNKIMTKNEKKGSLDVGFPSKLPNALAHILTKQIDDIERVESHRRNIADIYTELLGDMLDYQDTTDESSFLRLTCFSKEKMNIISFCKQRGIMLGSWYDTVIAPKDIDMTSTGYREGDCPNAEKYAAQSFNLPTHRSISMSDAKRVVSAVKESVKK